MRRGDQLNLRWEKVDFQRDVIYVPNSKTGKDYGVPMNEDVRNTLLVLRSEANGSDYVFINPKTKKPYTDLKKAFGTACRIAGIRDLHWHDLRHTFGTRLAEAGCSEATIASLMGHSDPQPRADIHMPQIALKERLWKPCGCCGKMFATNLPQRTNGCQSWQP